MQRVIAFIRLSRLHFLALPILCYTLGLGIARRERPVLDERLLVWGLLIELLVQLSVAYLNDYWDIPTDRLNTRRTLMSGGSGVLTTGVLPSGVAPIAAAVCQSAAVLLAIGVGLPAISWPILVLAMGAAIFYTAPPLRLSWHGVGELVTACVAVLLVPSWAYSLQMNRLSLDVLLLGLPLVPFVMSLFVVIATPDYDADRRVGKRTLPVQLGEHRIAALYAALLAAGYAAALLLWPHRTAVLLALALSLPLAAWAWSGLRPPIPSRPMALLFLILRAALVPAVLLIGLNLNVSFY